MACNNAFHLLWTLRTKYFILNLNSKSYVKIEKRTDTDLLLLLYNTCTCINIFTSEINNNKSMQKKYFIITFVISNQFIQINVVCQLLIDCESAQTVMIVLSHVMWQL